MSLFLFSFSFFFFFSFLGGSKDDQQVQDICVYSNKMEVNDCVSFVLRRVSKLEYK